ncbi:hypothetical protein BYT27DRAFT_7260340 [Phlegmacium glaucopus]|nr:hypothetical protein BYT27DRAFT_7260340 [Phlegmacium glaucopus]
MVNSGPHKGLKGKEPANVVAGKHISKPTIKVSASANQCFSPRTRCFFTNQFEVGEGQSMASSKKGTQAHQNGKSMLTTSQSASAKSWKRANSTPLSPECPHPPKRSQKSYIVESDVEVEDEGGDVKEECDNGEPEVEIIQEAYKKLQSYQIAEGHKSLSENTITAVRMSVHVTFEQ